MRWVSLPSLACSPSPSIWISLRVFTHLWQRMHRISFLLRALLVVKSISRLCRRPVSSTGPTLYFCTRVWARNSHLSHNTDNYGLGSMRRSSRTNFLLLIMPSSSVTTFMSSIIGSVHAVLNILSFTRTIRTRQAPVLLADFWMITEGWNVDAVLGGNLRIHHNPLPFTSSSILSLTTV